MNRSLMNDHTLYASRSTQRWCPSFKNHLQTCLTVSKRWTTLPSRSILESMTTTDHKTIVHKAIQFKSMLKSIIKWQSFPNQCSHLRLGKEYMNFLFILRLVIITTTMPSHAQAFIRKFKPILHEFPFYMLLDVYFLYGDQQSLAKLCTFT
jgi:hypothetical protein